MHDKYEDCTLKRSNVTSKVSLQTDIQTDKQNKTDIQTDKQNEIVDRLKTQYAQSFSSGA